MIGPSDTTRRKRRLNDNVFGWTVRTALWFAMARVFQEIAHPPPLRLGKQEVLAFSLGVFGKSKPRFSISLRASWNQ